MKQSLCLVFPLLMKRKRQLFETACDGLTIKNQFKYGTKFFTVVLQHAKGISIGPLRVFACTIRPEMKVLQLLRASANKEKLLQNSELLI